MLLARGVEGMVFVSPESTDTAASHDHYRQLKDEGVHMVFVNGGMPSLEVPEVGVDEQSAGYLATRHLLGARAHAGSASSADRPGRCRAGSRRPAGRSRWRRPGSGTARSWSRPAPYGPAGGADGDGPAAGDGAADRGDLLLRPDGARRDQRGAAPRAAVPRDLSVVGFDDIPLASYCTPALTTLAQPIQEIAAAAVDGLLAELESDPAPAHSRVFRPRLVVRDSTAPAGD